MNCSRLLPFATILLAGCASSPSLESNLAADAGSAMPSAELHHIDAVIVYDGNRDYLPRSLRSAAAGSSIEAKYSYEVDYATGKEHAATVFNPLLIVGMSKGQDAVGVTARLELSQGGESIKVYSNTTMMTKEKTLYSEGSTYTDMRRDGLLQVRDNIDAQIHKDREFWSGVGRGAAVPSIAESENINSTEQESRQ